MPFKRRRKRRVLFLERVRTKSTSYPKKKFTRERFIPPDGLTIVALKRCVIKMQVSLAVALRSKDFVLASKLIRNIHRSKLCHYWSVYRTISSKGSRSKGLSDKIRPGTNLQYQKLASDLWKIVKNPQNYKSTPLKRLWIPKPKGGLRPLSVPSYVDRALQHLYNLTLTVLHEEIAEQNSFGFRPYRSPGWVSKAITLAFWSRKGFGPPKYCIELDTDAALKML